MEKEVDGQTSFSIMPGSFPIRLTIDPMRLVVDMTSATVVRYEGRLPPMQPVAGKLKDLDARVEYQSVEASYR